MLNPKDQHVFVTPASTGNYHHKINSPSHNPVVSYTLVDGSYVVLSKYADPIWQLIGQATNKHRSHTILDFNQVPDQFRITIKQCSYRLMLRGLDGSHKPSANSVFKFFSDALPFLRYLEYLKISDLGLATPLICANYVHHCKEIRQAGKGGKPLSGGALERRFRAVENLHELSHYSDMPFPAHPWSESSSMHLAGLLGKRLTGKTPLIPDEVFTQVFNSAWVVVEQAGQLIDLRDDVSFEGSCRGREAVNAMNSKLASRGWAQGVRKFTEALNEIRTACYIVVASLSGCRNHELAYLKRESWYSSKNDKGELYWWMRSQSDKTDVGKTQWMIPEAAVTSLKVMDRWAAPYQKLLEGEISARRSIDSRDPLIAEAQKHLYAIFVSIYHRDHDVVRTLTNGSMNMALKSFVKKRGIKWNLATHQFRRKFASYAAKSKFGDLRYLREHFKHWSQDMTNDGYAIGDSQQLELYIEIRDEMDSIKQGLADQWMSPFEPLAGGYGKRLVKWRDKRSNIAMFKNRAAMVKSVADSHAIRSNGHAWCTADDNKCIGNSFEKTRCTRCESAVIGSPHASLYQRLYSDLLELAQCDDIGPGGQARVSRDLERCRDVLESIGHTVSRPL